MPDEEIKVTPEVTTSEPKKRIRRTPQQIADAIDVQIEDLKNSTQKIKDQKKATIEKYDSKIDAVKAKIKKLEERKAVLTSQIGYNLTQKEENTTPDTEDQNNDV